MSLIEIEQAIVLLPQREKEELFHFLAAELQQRPQALATDAIVVTSEDRRKWIEKLARLRSITANRDLRPTEEILDELREDRI